MESGVTSTTGVFTALRCVTTPERVEDSVKKPEGAAEWLVTLRVRIRTLINLFPVWKVSYCDIYRLLSSIGADVRAYILNALRM